MRLFAYLLLLALSFNACALENIQFDTPSVRAVEARMKSRHAELLPYYVSGAVGLNLDGTIVLRDIASVPLAARKHLNELVNAENKDRESLYAEIANANAHPEWQSQIRNAFAPRWIAHAQRGWWVMSDDGWIQK